MKRLLFLTILFSGLAYSQKTNADSITFHYGNVYGINSTYRFSEGLAYDPPAIFPAGTVSSSWLIPGAFEHDGSWWIVSNFTDGYKDTLATHRWMRDNISVPRDTGAYGTLHQDDEHADTCEFTYVGENHTLHGWSDSLMVGLDALADSGIVVKTEGTYAISYSVALHSVSGLAGEALFKTHLSLNDSTLEKSGSVTILSASQRSGTLTIAPIVQDLVEDDTVKLFITNVDDASNTISVQYAQLHLVKIGSGGGDAGYFKRTGGSIVLKDVADTLYVGKAKADSLFLRSENPDYLGFDVRALLKFLDTMDSEFHLPTREQMGDGASGSTFTLVTREASKYISTDTIKFRNPNNGSVVNVVNNTSSADTTINLQSIGGGTNVGVAVTLADVSNTDGTLTQDAYLYATIGGTTDHDIDDGSIWAGYLDLFFTLTTGTTVNFDFTLPDSADGYSVMDTFANNMHDNGTSVAMEHRLVYHNGLTGNHTQTADFGTTGTKYLRINFYLDNQYGFSGDLKFRWSAADGSSNVTLLKGSTLVAYRMK